MINLLIANVFVSSSISKFLNISSFKNAVSSFTGIKTNIFLTLLAFGISAIEIVAGLLLLIPYYHTISSYLLIILLALFVFFSIPILKKRTRVMCNCGGFLGNYQVTISLPIRNLCMIAALTFTIFSPADFNILHAFFNFEATFTLFCSEIIVVVILVFYRLGRMIFRDLMNKKERGLPNA